MQEGQLCRQEHVSVQLQMRTGTSLGFEEGCDAPMEGCECEIEGRGGLLEQAETNSWRCGAIPDMIVVVLYRKF